MTQYEDTLYLAFTFLDYSHVPTLCVVCKAWNRIASSNQLWEFYFHLLSNNRERKTKVSSVTISQDPYFWKNKIRDNFSSHTCRLSRNIKKENSYLTLWDLGESMPDRFSSQVVSMIMSRMMFSSICFTVNLSSPYQSLFNLEYGELHFKVNLKISGIEESIVVKWKSFVGDSYDYHYTPDYYLYFSKDIHDYSNQEFMNSNQIDFENLRKSKKCFIYKFNGKNIPSSVYGSEYLVENILNHIVPTVKEYSLSPLHFVPFWCLLFSLLLKTFTSSDYKFHKEVSKHFPNLILNRLANQFFKTNYQAETERKCFQLKISFQQYETNNPMNRQLLKDIISNKVDSLSFDDEQKLEIHNMYNCLTSSLPQKAFPQPSNSVPEGKHKILALLIGYLYRISNNIDDYMDWYLDVKFKRPFQQYVELSN